VACSLTGNPAIRVGPEPYRSPRRRHDPSVRRGRSERRHRTASPQLGSSRDCCVVTTGEEGVSGPRSKPDRRVLGVDCGDEKVRVGDGSRPDRLIA
jgi:hypothetical protein